MGKLYIGRLPFSETEDDLRELFARVGEVGSVKFIPDAVTGRSRGFWRRQGQFRRREWLW